MQRKVRRTKLRSPLDWNRPLFFKRCTIGTSLPPKFFTILTCFFFKKRKTKNQSNGTTWAKPNESWSKCQLAWRLKPLTHRVNARKDFHRKTLKCRPILSVLLECNLHWHRTQILQLYCHFSRSTFWSRLWETSHSTPYPAKTLKSLHHWCDVVMFTKIIYQLQPFSTFRVVLSAASVLVSAWPNFKIWSAENKFKMIMANI